ncbi:MAG: erythromycin esterase family protein [Gemmatimonadota bacterium]
MRRIGRHVVWLLVAAAPEAAAQAPDPDAFVAWATKNAHRLETTEPGHGLHDLAPVQAVAGTARVGAVGESIHGVREFLGLRHRMVELLVEKIGFTAVAIESGLPDSTIVYDYVLGADSTAGMWNLGFTWTMASFGDMRELVDWMRAYNRDPAHLRKLHFYGVDVAGGNGSWVPAAEYVLAYLDRVEPQYAKVVRARLLPLLEKFAKDGFTQTNESFSALTLEERNAVAAYVNELADRLELLRVPYLAVSSKEDYDWAHRIGQSLRYSSAMVTNCEARNRVNPVWNARDLAMAENVRWIREREGRGRGVIVLAHNAHIQTTKSVAAVVAANSTSLGMFLHSMIGGDYRSIGFAFNQGAMWAEAGTRIELPPAETGSIDWALAQVGLPLFFVDFRTIPKAGAVRAWLDRPVKQRIQNMSTEYNEFQSWDGLVFVNTITPSRLAEKPVAPERKDR